MDYAFIRRASEKVTQVILLLKDRYSRAVRAWLLRHKGIEKEEPVRLACEGIKELGYNNRVWLKVDNEPALLALRARVMTALHHAAAPLEVPAHESQSNGGVENGVKMFKGVLRVHLSALEAKIDGHLPTDHPVMTWLVQFVGDVITKHLVGADGKTPYERLHRIKPAYDCGYEFGGKVQWRAPKATEENAVIDGRWRRGLWMGRKWGGIVHCVIDEESGKLVHPRAVERLPQEERWDRSALAAVRVATWGAPPVDQAAPEVIIGPRIETGEAEPVVVEKQYVPKSVMIRPADLDAYGFTKGCRKCRLTLEKHPDAPKLKHSPACRQRIEERMRVDRNPRLLAADKRVVEAAQNRAGGGDAKPEPAAERDGPRRRWQQQQRVPSSGAGGGGRGGASQRGGADRRGTGQQTGSLGAPRAL